MPATVSFSEGSYGTSEMSLGSGWEGIELKANINDLTDERNWNNGTFNYGDDNGTNPGENDTKWIENNFKIGLFDLTTRVKVITI